MRLEGTLDLLLRPGVVADKGLGLLQVVPAQQKTRLGRGRVGVNDYLSPNARSLVRNTLLRSARGICCARTQARHPPWTHPPWPCSSRTGEAVECEGPKGGRHLVSVAVL